MRPLLATWHASQPAITSGHHGQLVAVPLRRGAAAAALLVSRMPTPAATPAGMPVPATSLVASSAAAAAAAVAAWSGAAMLTNPSALTTAGWWITQEPGLKGRQARLSALRALSLEETGVGLAGLTASASGFSIGLK